MGEQSHILKLCAEVIRAAAGLEEDEQVALDGPPEHWRKLALRAKDQLDEFRASQRRKRVPLGDRRDPKYAPEYLSEFFAEVLEQVARSEFLTTLDQVSVTKAAPSPSGVTGNVDIRCKIGERIHATRNEPWGLSGQAEEFVRHAERFFAERIAADAATNTAGRGRG